MQGVVGGVRLFCMGLGDLGWLVHDSDCRWVIVEVSQDDVRLPLLFNDNTGKEAVGVETLASVSAPNLWRGRLNALC